MLELVGAAYEAAYDRSRWRDYLLLLKAHTGAASACLVAADPGDGEVQLIEELTASPETNRKYREHFWQVDEYALAYLRSGLGPGKVWGSHELIPDARMAGSEFYNDMLQELDVFYFAGAILFQNGPSMICSGVQRSRRQGPPAAETMRLLSVLIPHQQRAILIDRRLRQLEATRRVTGELADALPYGLIALDRRGRVLAMNRMAEDVIAARDGLALGPEGLVGLRPRDDAALRRAVADALAATPVAGVVTLPRPSRLQPLRLVIAPVPGDGRLSALDDLAPAALVFLHDPAQRPAPPVALLRRTYGLTPQQARLSALLADGLSLAEAADRLGIAGATATSHLKQVFRKTGVRRQAELVRLVLSLPPDIGRA